MICLDTRSITVKEILKMTAVEEHFNQQEGRFYASSANSVAYIAV